MRDRRALTTSAQLGLALRAGRRAAGLSQVEVAEQMGVSQRYVSELERGKPGVLTDRLFALVRLLPLEIWAEIEESTAPREGPEIHGA